MNQPPRRASRWRWSARKRIPADKDTVGLLSLTALPAGRRKAKAISPRITANGELADEYLSDLQMLIDENDELDALENALLSVNVNIGKLLGVRAILLAKLSRGRKQRVAKRIGADDHDPRT